jgi:prophage antirepressor-like protein
MSTEIKRFVFPETGSTLTAMEYDGEVVFTPDDVANMIGHHSPKKVAALVRKHGQPLKHFVTLTGSEASTFASAVLPGGTASQIRSYTLLTEAGLYKALLHGETVLCRRAQDWITDEVLPSIRKTGGYGAQAAQQGITREEVAVIAATVVRTVLDEMSRTAPAPKGVVERVTVPDGLRAGQIARQFGTSVARVNAAVRALTSQYGTLGRKGPRTGWHEGETPYYNDLEVQEIRRVLVARGWVSPVREMDVETLFGDKAKGDKVH